MRKQEARCNCGLSYLGPAILKGRLSRTLSLTRKSQTVPCHNHALANSLTHPPTHTQTQTQKHALMHLLSVRLSYQSLCFTHNAHTCTCLVYVFVLKSAHKQQTWLFVFSLFFTSLKSYHTPVCFSFLSNPNFFNHNHNVSLTLFLLLLF